MLKINVELENLTTDEDTLLLELPMSESDLRAMLMSECEYIIIDYDSTATFENYDDVYTLNECLNRISSENPLITKELLEIILETSNYTYADEEGFLDKLCDNDFMYEEIEIPIEWLLTKEEYAAYYLCTKLDIPFSPVEAEMIEIKRVGKDFEWESIWDVYRYMGFCMSEDVNDDSKIYILNMEDQE